MQAWYRITSNSKFTGRSGPVVEVPRPSLLTSGHSKKRHPPYFGHEAVRQCRTNFARQPRSIDSAMRPGELDSKMPGRDTKAACPYLLCVSGGRSGIGTTFDRANHTNQIFDSLKVLRCSNDRTSSNVYRLSYLDYVSVGNSGIFQVPKVADVT
jgi:hypothetical protein